MPLTPLDSHLASRASTPRQFEWLLRWKLFAAGLALTGFLGCSSSAQRPAPAPWVQLEEYADSESESVLLIEPDGSFTGHENTTALKGAVTSEELEQLQQLASEPLLSDYRADALPADQDFEQWGYPVYRVVIRDVGKLNADEHLVDAFFVDSSLHATTLELVTYTKVLIAKYRGEK
jgi:hypothetical protein